MSLLNRKLLTLFVMFILAGSAFAGDTKANLSITSGEFLKVDLDEVIASVKSSTDGRRFIHVPSKPVSLQVKLMSLPEKRTIEYLYTALSVAGVDAMPKVSHRMFVASASGKVIPVYVEDKAAKSISQALKVDQDVHFYAFHVYNYSKGPAYLVVGYEKETGQ